MKLGRLGRRQWHIYAKAGYGRHPWGWADAAGACVRVGVHGNHGGGGDIQRGLRVGMYSRHGRAVLYGSGYMEDGGSVYLAKHVEVA